MTLNPAVAVASRGGARRFGRRDAIQSRVRFRPDSILRSCLRDVPGLALRRTPVKGAYALRGMECICVSTSIVRYDQLGGGR